MVVCTGCNGEFASVLSHANHLRHTRNPTCRAVLLQALAYLPKLDDSDTDMDDMAYLGIPYGTDEDPMAPANFDGDFFGDDYTMADFGMVGGDEGNNPGTMPADSDDEDDFNQGQGWEPERGTRSSRLPSLEGVIMDEDDENVPQVEVRHTAEERFVARPTVIGYNDAFPQSTTGMCSSPAQH